jgi:2-keto-4-pentenoate hydratase/2-oxohepta-3-ene-1,7-dioic acid hydratase in catechol pathway
MVERISETEVQPLSGNIFGQFWHEGEPIPLDSVRFLPPLMPSKVIGIGSNYIKHIEEMGRERPAHPKVFLKPNTSVIGHGDAIEIPPDTIRVDHEAELAVVIAKHLYRASEEEALNAILGLTIVNDVTARDFQRADGVFTRGKGFNTFCPMGPWLLLTGPEELLKPRKIKCWVDEELKQDSSTADLLFDIATVVSYASQIMTLLPGDVIATGTPSGVSPIQDGQRVRIEIEGLGVLENPVVNREDRCKLL